MTIALAGIIVESLYAGKHSQPPRLLSLKDLQREVTRRRIKEGLTPSVLRLLRRSPNTIWRLFRQVPQRRIVRCLAVLHSYQRIEPNEWAVQFFEDFTDDLPRLTRVLSLHGVQFSLTDDAGERSYHWWQETRKRLESR